MTLHGDGKSNSDINIRAAFVHVLGDLMQSVGVFIASLLIYFKPEWKIADPICTFCFRYRPKLKVPGSRKVLQCFSFAHNNSHYERRLLCPNAQSTTSY